MRSGLRVTALVLLSIVVIVAVYFGVTYKRQIWSYLTHWKGSPTDTQPYRAHPVEPALHIAAVGDIGDSGTRLDATADAVAKLDAGDDYHALLLLGDNVYPRGDPSRVPETVFAPFSEVLDGTTDLWAILGNHDVKDGNGPGQMEALGMPGRWWSTREGDVTIVGIDSNDLGNEEQLAFLERELSTSDATWKIVLLHQSPYSAGYQGSSTEAREVISPILARNGVQLVLSGHDHDYQRSKEIDGVTYVVSGGGAGTRRTGSEDFTEVSFSWHHFLDLAVFDDRIVGRAVNQSGRVADEFTLHP